jgi:hypothetical protein
MPRLWAICAGAGNGLVPMLCEKGDSDFVFTCTEGCGTLLNDTFLAFSAFLAAFPCPSVAGMAAGMKGGVMDGVTGGFGRECF